MSLNTLYQVATSHSADGMPLDATVSGLSAFAPAVTTPPGPPGGGANPAAGRSPEVVGPWIACDEPNGVIEIHDPRLLRPGHDAFCRALVEAAVARFGAHRADVSMETSTCRLEFGPGRFDRAAMAHRVESAVRAATPAVRIGAVRKDDGGKPPSSAPDDGVRIPGTGDRASDNPRSADGRDGSPARRPRLVHLAMAGGSLTLAAAAVILPGLPTLPFLIMTGRHAVLVSPRIERMLKRHAWCAAMLAEGETASGPTMGWRSLSKMIVLGVLFAVGIWILHPPLPVILVLEIALMAFLGYREWLTSDLAEIGLDAVA